MELSDYINALEKNHKKKIQTGFEKNDRRIFIDEILGQLGYSIENIYDDVPQKGKTPDIRLYGNNEVKSKNTMSRFVIETKNYGSLEKDLDNIDFLQLKNYIKTNIGKITYIASTDYISFFLFKADAIINENKLDLKSDNISKSESYELKKYLIRKFDFINFSKEDEQKFQTLSHQNLFETYDFPNPEKNSDRFNIQNRKIRDNFIKSLYYIMEEINEDISVKFNIILDNFLHKYNSLDAEYFKENFIQLVNNEEFKLILNFFLWTFEMNYLDNFFEKQNTINKSNLDSILKDKNPEGKDYYYNEYLVTCIYSIINKTLFIRILEDSGTKGVNIFLKGEEAGRYLSNGILYEKFLNGKLREYVNYIFEFKNEDLKQYHFLLKHDIYDWIISEIEEYTLLHFLKVFNEIYLKELDQDILGDIYEHYLQEDRDEEKGKTYRRMLGQYYTPRPIVRLMWYLINEVYNNKFERSLYPSNQKLLDILDPFMGSGTFLNEAVLHMKMADSGKKIVKGEVFHFFKDRNKDKKIEESLIGFEKNPLSCSIADINIYFRLIKSFPPDRLKDTPIKDLNLLRTNSFDLTYVKNNGNNQFQSSLYSEEIKTTFIERGKIKDAKTKKYDIIVSNPPYGIIKPNVFMKEELIPFAYSEYNFDKNGNEIGFNWNSIKKGKIPKIERNRGKLRDMYAFAYGVADKLIKDEGIICFITSNTFLSLPTYKWMRKYWLNNYTIHYIVNFNRIMEKSNSMFSPEASISTAIILMTKNKPDKNHKVKYLDISDLDSVKEKFDYFNIIEWKEPAKNKNDILSFKTKNINDLKFKEISINSFLKNEDYELIKFDENLEKIKESTDFLINFGVWTNGIITKEDNLFFDYNKKKLEKIIKERFGERNFDSRKIKQSINPKQIIDYTLDSEPGYIYYDKDKLWRERDPNEMKKRYKLILSCDYFYVDSIGVYPLFNAVKGKNCYFLTNDNEDILYYISGILNSKLGKYYRYETQIDNYERFPIKKIDFNGDIFENFVKEIKDIHEIKSDYELV
jgi:hypothetical protein